MSEVFFTVLVQNKLNQFTLVDDSSFLSPDFLVSNF